MTTPKTSLTVEPEPSGHGQHMITVERDFDPDLTQGMILTDAELSALGPLIDRYRAAQGTVECAIEVTFTDSSGRFTAEQMGASS